jgi:hypothetical protein
MYNYELKMITGVLNTCRNISALFPKKMSFIHYVILFGSHNIKVFL